MARLTYVYDMLYGYVLTPIPDSLAIKLPESQLFPCLPRGSSVVDEIYEQFVAGPRRATEKMICDFVTETIKKNQERERIEFNSELERRLAIKK